MERRLIVMSDDLTHSRYSRIWAKTVSIMMNERHSSVTDAFEILVAAFNDDM